VISALLGLEDDVVGVIQWIKKG